MFLLWKKSYTFTVILKLMVMQKSEYYITPKGDIVSYWGYKNPSFVVVGCWINFYNEPCFHLCVLKKKQH